MCFPLTFLIICTLNAGLVMAPDFAQAGYDCARAEVEQGGLLLDGSCRF